jgi:hypothetical protein
LARESLAIRLFIPTPSPITRGTRSVSVSYQSYSHTPLEYS